MKRLILILLIALVLSQKNPKKDEPKGGSRSIRRPPPRPKCGPGEKYIDGKCYMLKCGPGEKSIDGQCFVEKPKCGPGEKYADGRCYVKKPTCRPGERLVNGLCQKNPPGPRRFPQKNPVRCGPGEIVIKGVCQKKDDKGKK